MRRGDVFGDDFIGDEVVRRAWGEVWGQGDGGLGRHGGGEQECFECDGVYVVFGAGFFITCRRMGVVAYDMVVSSGDG